MKMANQLESCLFVAMACAVVSLNAAEPVRLKRADAFLGVHFDFHAKPEDTNIGARTTREMVSAIIDRVHPDYVQCDCKGHPGYSSYPTQVGNPAPGVVGDPLRVWREVTRDRGVALFMHYSGVYDRHAVSTHPDWAAMRADGKPDERATSVFGPYADKLLVPQLRELAGSYGVDGAWVDGECWATVPDYGEAAVRAFRDRFHAEPPRKRGDPLWEEWKEFHREGFRAYLRHYVSELKSSHPQFQIISNWAFSDHMPEPVSAGVAALSGDFSPENSVNSARFTARCFENQGLAWDLMSWGFNRKTRAPKTAAGLEQEAAIVLALGGGYQTYFTQERDGSVRMRDLDVMGEVAKFCRERQAFCHKSEAVPQVALLYSRAAHYRNANALFHPSGDPAITVMKSALTSLLEARQSVQIVSEHHLAGNMPKWPLIVVAGWDSLEPQFQAELAAYAKGGGSLLLVGDGSAKLFAAEMEVGKIAAVASPSDIGPALKQVFPSPLVEVSGSPQVEVCVRRLNGKLMIHLINTSGDHANLENRLVESVPPLGAFSISIRLAKQPRALTLQPAGTALDVKWKDGVVTLTIPGIALHSIVQVEE